MSFPHKVEAEFPASRITLHYEAPASIATLVPALFVLTPAPAPEADLDRSRRKPRAGNVGLNAGPDEPAPRARKCFSAPCWPSPRRSDAACSSPPQSARARADSLPIVDQRPAHLRSNPGRLTPRSNEVVGDIFEGLVRIDPLTTLPEPGLAESWELRDGGKSIVFHLRHGVKWFDGAAIHRARRRLHDAVMYDKRVPNSMRLDPHRRRQADQGRDPR